MRVLLFTGKGGVGKTTTAAATAALAAARGRTTPVVSTDPAPSLADAFGVPLDAAGDDLVVTVGGHRRVLALPGALRRCAVAGARVAGGRLVVRFEPDPQLWRSA